MRSPIAPTKPDYAGGEEKEDRKKNPTSCSKEAETSLNSESIVVAMSHCNFSHKICSRQRDTATLSHGKTETSQFVSQI